MFNDLSKSIKAQLYERVSSPLLASFSLSWAVWNYRFILVIVSSMSPNEKIAYIDSHIFQSSQDVFLRGTLYPLITALCLIFVYPIPARYVYQYWRKKQKELKEVQQQIDDETPLTKEEARQIRREALTASLEYDRAIQSQSAEIARLKELVETLQAPNSSAPENRSDSDNKDVPSSVSVVLDDSQIKMLEKIAKAHSGVLHRQLIASANDNVLAEYNLGELINGEYVLRKYDRNDEDYRITATHKGRAIVVKRDRDQSA